MNKKIKRKLIKKIDRQLSSMACQFFLYGNPNLKRVFKFRVWQYTHMEMIEPEDFHIPNFK